MPEEYDAADPKAARRRDPRGAQSEAWKRTLEDMDAIAEDRREDGWEVATVMTAQTDTVSRDMGEDDTFGLIHVIPGNYVDRFTDAYESGEYDEYLVYGTDVDGFMFAVIEWLDPERERSILIACRYDMTMAGGMITSARKEGALYSHVKKIDGTILGTFEYEEYEPLITKPSA